MTHAQKAENFRGYAPHALLRTGQVARTEVVRTMLRQNGFVFENQEGSHIKMTNHKHGLTITIVENTNKVDSQYNAAELCLEVRKREAAEKAAEIEALKLQFRQASNSPAGMLDVKMSIPDHIEAVNIEGFDDYFALRSRLLPEVGVLAPIMAVKPEVDRLVQEVERKEENLLATMNNAVDTLEMSYGRDEDVLYFGNLEHGFMVPLEKFDGLNSSDAQRIAESTIAYSEMYDNAYTAHLQAFLEKAQRDGKATGESLPDGKTKWTIQTVHLITRETHISSIATSPQFRAPADSFHQMFQSIYAFETGGKENPDHLHEALKKYDGFKVSRPMNEKKLGRDLVVTHPYFPDITFKIPAPDTYPNLATLFAERAEADVDRRMEIESELYDTVTARINARNVIHTAHMYFMTELANISERTRALRAKTEKLSGLRIESDWDKTKAGEEFTIKYSHPDLGGPLRIRAIRVHPLPDNKTRTVVQWKDYGRLMLQTQSELTYIARPEDIEKWENILGVTPPPRAADLHEVLRRFRETQTQPAP